MMTEERSDRKEELLSVISNSGMMSLMYQAPPPPPPLPAPPIPQPPIPQPPPEEEPYSNLICRDYLRNSCVRPMCRFIHSFEGKLPKDKINFCHDFQNGKCVRSNCKFIHCSMEEEDEFYRTEKLPPSVVQRFIERIQGPKEDPPPPPIPVEMSYQPQPPLPSPHLAYNVPPPPPMTMEQWMPRTQQTMTMTGQRENMDYASEQSTRGIKRSRFQDIDNPHFDESMVHCHNCSNLLRINAETKEKIANLSEKCKELEEKNSSLTRTVDLLLDRSKNLMKMFTDHGITPHTSASSQALLSSSQVMPPQSVSRITHLLSTSSAPDLVIASIPSPIHQDMIYSSTAGYNASVVMRPPFSASGCMDGNVYSTATLGKGLVESGQSLIMTPRCNEIQRPILTSQAILPNSMVLSNSQIQIIPATQQSIMKSSENMMVINAPQSMSNSSRGIISTPTQQMTSSSHQPYFPTIYTHNNKS